VGVPGGATVDVVLLLVVGVGAVVVVVDDEGMVVGVDVLVVVVGVRIGRDSDSLRLRSSPAHCVVRSGTAPTARVLLTSVAVRLVGSSSDCRASGVPPVAAAFAMGGRHVRASAVARSESW
jgi:hypothetical protein